MGLVWRCDCCEKHFKGTAYKITIKPVILVQENNNPDIKIVDDVDQRTVECELCRRCTNEIIEIIKKYNWDSKEDKHE